MCFEGPTVMFAGPDHAVDNEVAGTTPRSYLGGDVLGDAVNATDWSVQVCLTDPATPPGGTTLSGWLTGCWTVVVGEGDPFSASLPGWSLRAALTPFGEEASPDQWKPGWPR